MARTTDLGWAVARAGLEGMGEDILPDLTIMEPEAEDSEAKSMRLVGPEALCALRDIISDILSDYEAALAAAGKEATAT